MHIDHAFQRPALQRSVTLRGAKFYRSPPIHDAGCALHGLTAEPCDCTAAGSPDLVLFVNHLDASTREGPREAMETDAARHPDAYQRFLREDAEHQAGRPHMPGVELERQPLRPLVQYIDPPEGAPPREIGPHERKRNAVAAKAREDAGL